MDGLSEQVKTSIADEVFAGGGEMGALMRSLDWSTTPLGPVENWPQSLRTAVSICLASYFPMLIWWGPELVKLYNDAYRPMLGATKHPGAMGQRGRECWPEIWDIIGPMLDGVLREGKATWSENQLLLLERNGYPEECYFTFSYSPIRDESGGIGGIFTAVTETTQQVLSERRLLTLRELATSAYEAQTAEDACRVAAKVLAKNTADIPFARLYLLDSDGKQARLVSSSGFMDGTTVSLSLVDLSLPEELDGAWPLAQVVSTGQAALVTNASILPTSKDAIEDAINRVPTRQSALVLPIARPGQKEPYGLLVAGVSPLLQLDDNYRGFFTLIASQVAATIANVRAYQEALAQAEALAELDRAKTAFFSNVSHEFRTPLTLLLGPIEDALADTEQVLLPRQRERLEIVRRNALRLLKLVNTLLDFSRIEAGRAQAVYEPTDLAALTNDLASVFRSAIEKAGLRFVVDCPPLPEAVYVDREMWEKIVLNLLSNAFKFTFAGQITVELRSGEDHVELVITDTGAGIPAEELPLIFQRFHRVRDTHARTYEGTGIGLSLVQELVRLHGGNVQVESSIGAGTIFTVSIPRGSSHLPTDRLRATRKLQSLGSDRAYYIEEAQSLLPANGIDADETGAIHPTPGESIYSTPTNTIPPSSTAGYILLADDNADMREYLKRLLSEHWSVETTANGAEALEAARTRLPDLVLSDVMMPEMDGFQLLQALRSDPRTAAIPVVLLSARAGEEPAVEGLQAGADDYLVKPFSTRELLARVSTHLELARIRREIASHSEENARLYQNAQDAIRLRDELFSIVSHDLKNPVATVKGFAQLLKRMVSRINFPDKAQQEQLVDGLSRIDLTATRMTALINELLDIAHFQIGKPLNLDLRETDLVRLAHQAIISYQQTTERHKFSIEIGEPELVGWWDTVRLERVFGNLLSNAIKYSPEGGNITVKVTKENGEWAVLSVEDQGVGIPPDDLPHIFDRFHRAANVAGQIKGSGIGLASARQIIKQHSGFITVTSQEGKGSTFTVRLPMKVPDEDANA